MGKNGKWGANPVIKLAIKQVGQQAEDQACAYLLSHGLKLVWRNFVCKVGEVDLIMRDNQTLVFIEVRYRNKKSQFGSAAESVHAYKQKKIIKAASFFLLTQKRFRDFPCRFDVISMSSEHQASEEILWIKDAFQVEYGGY